MIDLAEVSCACGDYAEAENLLRIAVSVHQKMFGMSHRSTLDVSHSLADALRYQGKYKEACTLCESVLGHRRLYYGDQHPKTMQAVNNLANCYDGLGRQADATTLIFESSRQLTSSVAALST